MFFRSQGSCSSYNVRNNQSISSLEEQESGSAASRHIEILYLCMGRTNSSGVVLGGRYSNLGGRGRTLWNKDISHVKHHKRNSNIIKHDDCRRGIGGYVAQVRSEDGGGVGAIVWMVDMRWGMGRYSILS